MSVIILAVVTNCQNILYAQTNTKQQAHSSFSIGADSSLYCVTSGQGESIAESRHCALQNFVSMIESTFCGKAAINSEVFSEGASTADIGDIRLEIKLPGIFPIDIDAVIADEKWVSRPHKISDEDISIEIHIDILLKVNISSAQSSNTSAIYE